MALILIRINDDPILRKISKKVESFDNKLWILLEDMKETVLEENGVGIAAPQVGILKRAVITNCNDKLCELINPEIASSSEKQDSVEGCLSLPGKFGVVKRPKKIKVFAKNRNGKKFTLEAENFLAAVLCHEIDHLNGILFKSKAFKMLDKKDLEE